MGARTPADRGGGSSARRILRATDRQLGIFTLGLQPRLIHGWVNQVLAQAERAFDRPTGKRRSEEAKERKIAHLEDKLTNKNEVIAELLQEHVQLKKELGEL